MATLDPSPHARRRRDARLRRRRQRSLLALVLVAAAAAVVVFALLQGGDDAEPPTVQEVRADRLVPGSAEGQGIDPLRYSAARRTEFEERAAAGAAHVIYAKVPGGAVATAERVAALRPQVEAATEGKDVDPDVLEAIVLLESGGRPDARASNDLNGAAGLTQILAETGQNLLGMKIDVKRSTTLTRGIDRGRKVAARTRLRAKLDERFDAEKSLAATVKYLGIAKDELGSDEKAVAAYHMGIGNLQTALKRFGSGDDIPYAELYFGSTPLAHAEAYAFLAGLGDDSSTYLWRIHAAEEIMRLYREDPDALAAQAELQTRKNSAEDVLRPEADTTVFESGDEIRAAVADGELRQLSPRQLAAHGLRIDADMGGLAPRLDEPKRTFRALTPDALAVLSYIGAGVQGISGAGPLTVTSTVRDTPYQRLLTRTNIEATRAYSLHTTGNAFDLSRSYVSDKQGPALQFMLDRLQSLDIIAWVREPAAIHATAGPHAAELLPLLRPGAPVAAPVRTAG